MEQADQQQDLKAVIHKLLQVPSPPQLQSVADMDQAILQLMQKKVEPVVVVAVVGVVPQAAVQEQADKVITAAPVTKTMQRAVAVALVQ